MDIQSIGYVGVASEQLDSWREFGTHQLGMQAIDVASTRLALRMDDRQQRFMIERGAGEGCRFFGWEVADSVALERLAARLDGAGVAVTAEPGSLAARRGVTELISCRDPAGNRLEFFFGAAPAAERFVPGRTISGFRTGVLGLGHVVLTTDSIESLRPFYQDLLEFRLSDYTLRPFKASFFHINARHHSLAMVETGVNGIHHVMVELLSLDDVGQGYDLALANPADIAVTLGRHTNDLMTSFYLKTPSGFMLEYGWGGRNIDMATWQSFECDYGPSLWGHERSWLDPERRALARSLRLQAAQRGYRAPVYVLPENHVVMDDAPARPANAGDGS